MRFRYTRQWEARQLNRESFDRRPINPNLRSVMKTRLLDSDSLTQRLKDRQVSNAVVDGTQQLTIQFSDGTALIVEACSDGLLTHVESASRSATQDTSQRPTQRQLEYLAFIAKYIHRFGRAPAERDIERHFLVSAPTVNQMMQMLERRGFITRQPGVPRSIRICIDLTTQGTLGPAR
jgi:repressor LexA